VHIGLLGLSACLLASCASPELPLAQPEDLARLGEARPLAVLFSVPGCRYCAIAERGLVGAARRLAPEVEFCKVMVDGLTLPPLMQRYGLQATMPQARLLLGGGRWKALPLTREGDRVAEAIRGILGALTR
jgi:hypothetical protein